MKTRFLFAALLTFALVAVAEGRTIVLTGEDLDQVAVINDKAPRASWAGIQGAPAVWDSTSQVQMFPGMSILTRFPLDAIPKDQKIVKAELTINCQYNVGNLQVRRLMANWGTGVCHQYLRTFPKKEEWSQPGGQGAGTDRAAKDSAVFKITGVGDSTVDVTEDVELWYTGSAPNRGWIFTLEKGTGPCYLASPYSPQSATAKQWKLQITFEPQ